MKRTTTDAATPALLMLSHCLPWADGRAMQARAWRLLRMAERTHRVLLVCRGEGRMHLRQWRALRALAEQLVLEPPRRTRAWLGGLLGTIRPAWGHHLAVAPPPLEPTQVLAERTLPEAILCTTPLLYPLAARLGAGPCLIDVDDTYDPRWLPALSAADVVLTGSLDTLDRWRRAGVSAALVPDNADAAVLPWGHAAAQPQLSIAPRTVLEPAIARAA